jgi:uncharacterized protein (TIGR04141 family)
LPKYNIYKIIRSKLDELIFKFESVGLKKVSSRIIDNYYFDFYFSKEPPEISIWWVKVYNDFIPKEETPKNLAYFASLLIYNDDVCYAVSMGKSHFYLKNYCDLDFGLNLAERIIDETKLTIKNAKYFSINKSKTITTYRGPSRIDYDSGESFHYIKAKTIDEKTWGRTVSFGHSVCFNLNIKPDQLAQLISLIEETLKKPKILTLPRIEMIKDKESIKELDRKLALAIEKKEPNIQIDEVTMSGVDFIFSDKSNYTIYLKGKQECKLETEELTMPVLHEFLKKYNINLYEELENIKIKAINENQKPYTESLKHYIDFVDAEKHCLMDGKWYKFNQDYVAYLEKEVNGILNEYDPKDDLMMDEYNEYLSRTGQDSKKMYKEKYFNAMQEQKGYRLLDREIEKFKNKYSVEKMDLYKDGTLFFVKIGTPQKLSYVINQSLATLEILKNEKEFMKVDGEIINPKRFCLWLVLDRTHRLSLLPNGQCKISEIESLIFHMKLVEWKKEVIRAGLEPYIKINYVVK